ncbi:hypothetical protein BS78_03G052500 [Paspalum vaginatum]|nr:hypothetical protein BS78_03G052500 [Paspalum vaginatum]
MKDGHIRLISQLPFRKIFFTISPFFLRKKNAILSLAHNHRSTPHGRRHHVAIAILISRPFLPLSCSSSGLPRTPRLRSADLGLHSSVNKKVHASPPFSFPFLLRKSGGSGSWILRQVVALGRAGGVTHIVAGVGARQLLLQTPRGRGALHVSQLSHAFASSTVRRRNPAACS